MSYVQQGDLLGKGPPCAGMDRQAAAIQTLHQAAGVRFDDVNPYEIMTLAVALAVSILLLYHRRRFAGLPHLTLLLAAVLILASSHLFANFEEFLELDLFHLAEHLMLTISSVLLALWCWMSLHHGRRGS